MTVLSNNTSRLLFLAALGCACGDADSSEPSSLNNDSAPAATTELDNPAEDNLPEDNSNTLIPDELPIDETPSTDNADPPAELEDTADLDGSTDEPLVDSPLSACSTPSGVSGRPEDVSGLLELINALPAPVTVACLLESLERPLDLFMTSSTFSAQPAFYESPRTFIFLGPLVLSIVPGGSSSRLLEFGQRTDGGRSIKGEIVFPVSEDVTEDTLLEQIRLSERGSVCGGCHAAEERLNDQDFDAAYESIIIVPNPQYEVDIDTFWERNRDCDYQFDGPRCEILNALFENGEVRRTELWQ